MPLSRWNMNAQVMTAAYTGRAYGVRKTARSSPRPRKFSCIMIAAATPKSQDRPTARTVNAQVTRNELSRSSPIGALKSTAIR